MELKRAKLNNLEELTRMNIQLRIDEKMDNVMTEGEVRKRIGEFLNSGTYEVILCSHENEIIGYGVMKVQAKPLYLRQLFIKPEFRGKGFGKEFLGKLIEYYETETIDIEVMVWNDPAIRFYEEFGFKRRYIGMRFAYDKGSMLTVKSEEVDD